MNVSLILPCYNPPQEWERNVASNYADFCSRTGQKAELIIVTDGISQTVTEAQLAYLQKEIPGILLIKYTENRGKGFAIRQGVAQASGDVLIYTDIDFPYTQDSLYTIYDALNSGNTDVAVGVKDDSYYSHIPPVRKAISRMLRFMIRAFLSLPITDTQCGLKGFHKKVAPIFLQTTINRYLFDLEFIRNCYKTKRYKITAIPVVLNEDVHFRKMNYRILLPELMNFVSLLGKRPHE